MVRLKKKALRYKRGQSPIWIGQKPPTPRRMLGSKNAWELWLRVGKATGAYLSLKLISTERARKANFWLLWNGTMFLGRDAGLLQVHHTALHKWCVELATKENDK